MQLALTRALCNGPALLAVMWASTAAHLIAVVDALCLLLLQALAVVDAAGAEAVVGVLDLLLLWWLQALLDGLDVGQVGADALPVHEGVQRPGHSAGRVAAQPGPAARRVHPAGGAPAERAGRAAAAARLPHQLGAALRGLAAGQPLLRARRALDRLLPAAPRPRRRRRRRPRGGRD